MIRKILVPVRGDGKGDNVLAHAAALSHRSGAHIEVAHCRPRPEDLLPFGVPIPNFMVEGMKAQATQLADAEEEKLVSEFRELSAKFNLRIVERQTRETGTVSWIEGEGKMVDVIKQHGRLSDLICVAKPDRDRNLGTNTLKAALFHTGRPVMMCPPVAPPAELGRHVAIAWNGSAEAVRALVMARRMIEAADKVTILGSGASPIGTGSDELQHYLDLREISATTHRFTVKRNAGEALLNTAAEIGADMMIMGAYGDSHEQETIFGGNTQRVVDSAELPVVLVH